MEYTSKGVGNAALTTGIIGTALGAMASAGGLAGLLGINPQRPEDPGDKPVTRYEMGLIQQIIPNTYLSGTKYHSYPDGSGTNGTHYNDFGYAVFADQVINSISTLSATDAVKIIPM